MARALVLINDWGSFNNNSMQSIAFSNKWSQANIIVFFFFVANVLLFWLILSTKSRCRKAFFSSVKELKKEFQIFGLRKIISRGWWTAKKKNSWVWLMIVLHIWFINIFSLWYHWLLADFEVFFLPQSWYTHEFLSTWRTTAATN